MKLLIGFLVMTVSFSALSATCYQVSISENVWSRTPETLCINKTGSEDFFQIKLNSGLSFEQQTVATFNLNLLERARCMDCNQDVYGLANPSNSSFNALSIRFNGKRDMESMKEEGTVSIGETKFFYRFNP